MSAPTLEELLALSGLEQLRLSLDGTVGLATIGDLLGFAIVDLADGRVTFELTPDERMLNPMGTVHGGVTATLLDSAMACAVHSTLAPGLTYTTAQLNVHYLRAMTPRMGAVRAIGTVIHRGRRQSTAEGKLIGPDGRLIAHGTTTCLILTP